MTDLTRQLLVALSLIAVLAGVFVLAIAVGALVRTAIRVGLQGRVLVIPFRGAHPGRAELTGLFVHRLRDIETEWTASARAIRDLKTHFEEQSPAASTPAGDDAARPGVAPIVRGETLARGGVHSEPEAEGAGFGTAPRTIGDEFLDEVLLLEEEGSIAGADVGVLSIGGVSVSPQQVLALLRRIPGLSARRVVSGAIVSAGDRAIVSVYYEERPFRRPARRVTRTRDVIGDSWLPALEQLAFELATARIALLRDERDAANPDGGDAAPSSASNEADRTIVEARSWKACDAFLRAYILHLRHYTTGSAVHRERAVDRYRQALAEQPEYSRAAYNCATLLYNRYLPPDNDEAIALFRAAAAASDDVHERALAYAGLAMAYCQARNRFESDTQDLVRQAKLASDDAGALSGELEEVLLAQAWALQLGGERDKAIRAYRSLAKSGTTSLPGRRIASMAGNNAAWLLLHGQDGACEESILVEAEDLLWAAVHRYPNKIAHANLAEIARRCARHDVALAHLTHAVQLDDTYVNGWNELACLEVEMAGSAEGHVRARYLDDAHTHHDRAVTIAQDPGYVAALKKSFDEALARHGLAIPPSRRPPARRLPWLA